MFVVVTRGKYYEKPVSKGLLTAADKLEFIDVFLLTTC